MPLTIDQGVSSWYPMARAYKWDIKFDGYPDPFPASASSNVWQSIMNGTVDYVPGGYSYPELATRGDISITAHEIKDHQLQDYFIEWRKEISDNGMTISLLAEAAREVILTPLKLDNGVIKTITLVVIPDGQITYEYTSDKNSGLSAAISFKVVGE
jgi:hypothetical protein